MKKLFAFISLLLVSSAMIFADVTVKKLDNSTAEVTFFYGNPRATEVLLAGDFNNWQNGAEAMTKTDKGFTITKTFKITDELRYKFISDGNWTTDLKAPDFVDDGFGGKNSHVVIADMVGGDDDGAKKAKINFISWTMLGVQGNYITQGKNDATKKGLDLDSVSVGFKSYNKFAGSFLPGCPLYIEIALSESDLENYDGNQAINYLYQKGADDTVLVDWDEGFKRLVNGIFANPVQYLAQTSKNNEGVAGETVPGPGSRPFLGHLKFGFNTPYVNFLTGFNYAKPDIRQAITWKTVTGNWDAGYQHAGGFNVFSLGDKSVAALEEATGLTFDIGFAPNRSADRKGTLYGYWAWAGIKKDDLVVDFQSNGMYGDDYLFYDPVEHDFILGAKDTFSFDDAGKLKVAVQALVATHQKEFTDNAGDAVDYFGYSTDIWYRDTDFSAQKLAGNVQVGFENSAFGANLEYRFRGAQASMLYVRENHDDATFDLSDELGVANEQRIKFDGFVNAGEIATINLGVAAKMPFQQFKGDEDEVVKGRDARPAWYDGRFDDNRALYYRGEKSGVELAFDPSVDLNIAENVKLNVYGNLKYRAYEYFDGIDKDEANKYSASDSAFKFNNAGIKAEIGLDSDVITGVNVFYGIDNSNDYRLYNTLAAQAMFAGDVTATLAFGVKTWKDTDAKKADIADEGVNNPFAFAVGVAKRFKAMKKPTLYAQFVYNMDPFKHFGDGQDALNLDKANIKGSVEKEGLGNIDAVDWYDGRAALRVGIRWDI